MSYFIRVLCRSESRLKVRFVSEFLRDGVYFDALPALEAVPSQDLDSEFDQVEIRYDTRKRPIIITSTVGDDLTHELLELNAMAQQAEVSDLIMQHIASTRQIVAIEVDQANLADVAWNFCDCIEASIASSLDGIVFAPDDGFYDKQLQLIQRTS